MRHKCTTTFLAGNMWGGKTTLFTQILSTAHFRKNLVAAFECGMNNRNTERDLSYIPNIKFPVYRIDGKQDINTIKEIIKQLDVIGFEEIHLYTLNPELEKIFLEAFYFARENCREIYLSGLLQDSYNDNNVFSVHKKILMLCDEIKIYPSAKPCVKCGTDKDVIYAKAKPEAKEKVGDAYDMICYRCYE